MKRSKTVKSLPSELPGLCASRGNGSRPAWPRRCTPAAAAGGTNDETRCRARAPRRACARARCRTLGDWNDLTDTEAPDGGEAIGRGGWSNEMSDDTRIPAGKKTAEPERSAVLEALAQAARLGQRWIAKPRGGVRCRR